MKVLHCIHSVNPVGGGPVEFIRQIVTLHEREGISIEIISLDDPNDPWVKDFPCKVHALGPGLLSYGFSWRFVSWLRKNRKNYDIVVVNGIWQFSSFGTSLALKDSDTPYVVFTHGMLDPWFKQNYPLKHLKKSAYWPWADYWVLKDAKAVLFTSEEEKELAAKSFPIYECNQIVTGFGSVSPPSTSQHLKTQFPLLFPQLAGKRIMLFMGRIHEKKGCDLLLESFAQVASNVPEMRLLMAGPAKEPYLLALKELTNRLGVSERVDWCGMLTGESKWSALSYAEVMILPSHQENFGVVVAEALACGTAVLISNKVNIWREIRAAGAGFVADDTLEGTGQLIASWLQQPEDAKQDMSENARRCFEKHFDIESTFRRLIVVFEQIVH